MKKLFLILLFIVLVLTVCFFLAKKTVPDASPMVQNTNGESPLAVQQPKTNLAVQTPTPLNSIQSLQLPQTSMPPTEKLNAMSATSLAEWKTALPKLQRLNPSDIEESWVLEERDPNNYPSVLLTGNNGTNVDFAADFVDVQAVKPDDHIRSIEIHTPNMNINETRQMGIQLCDLLGRDPKDFLAWCDKVGNSWVDAPLFSSGGLRVSESNKFDGFGVHSTFNSEKPWYILFFITDP